MKKLLLLFTLFLTMTVAAQKNTYRAVPVNNKAQNGSNENLPARINDINNRIDALVMDIEALYNTYNAMEDKWFLEKRNKKELKIEGERMRQDTLREKIKQCQNSIESMRNELRWIDTLRMYYENGSLDDLYRGDERHPKMDLQTLSIHKQLLGANCPRKKMEDLALMAECANSLKSEYNAARNKDYRSRLGKVAECDTKWDIDGLLALHGDIQEEVDKWKDHSLRGFMTFTNYLMTEYGVDLETDFPILAGQARKKIDFSK